MSTNITKMTSELLRHVVNYGLKSPLEAKNLLAHMIRYTERITTSNRQTLGLIGCVLVKASCDDFRSQERDDAIRAITPIACKDCGESIPYDFVFIEDASEDDIFCVIVCPFCLMSDHFDIPLVTEVPNGN